MAQVLWHPLGANSSSLLVLTNDSILREYSINEDVEEPAQTLSFSNKSLAERSAAGGRRGGFSSDDLDEETAVGLCTGAGEADWGPLTLFGLMANGDIKALCPFLPKKS